MENGGADKPGGQGGTVGAQDGNNGSGNDIDCEDDNRGQGVPGHCRAKSRDAECLPGKGKGAANSHAHGRGHGQGGTARATCFSTPSESAKLTSAPPDIPVVHGTGDTAPGSYAGPSTTEGTASLVEVSPPVAGSPTAEVLGAEASRTATSTLAGAEVAGVSAAATPSVLTGPTAGVLPNTGAGMALGLFLLTGVVAVALGVWMLTKRAGLASKQV
jgi:hypothetical protein